MFYKPIIAGNWKMHHTVNSAIAAVRILRDTIPVIDQVNLIVFPPFIALPAVLHTLQGSSISVGAQTVHWENEGAFTGEISTAMLRDLSVQYAIIGHSERRRYFAETDERVNKRLQAALSAGLHSILCIGESLEEYQAGRTEAVISTQIRAGLSGIDSTLLHRLIIAYEPIWAIGTGMTASPEQAQSVHILIRTLLRQSPAEKGKKLPILYGGSVKAENVVALLKQADIDGVLVGAASVDPRVFAELIMTAAYRQSSY